MEPVELSAASLSTTAQSYLRELKAELAAEGRQPAKLSVTARFDEDCSLATQSEADRLRELVQAGAFLGVGVVALTVETGGDRGPVRTALSALEERARREGVTLSVTGADVPT